MKNWIKCKISDLGDVIGGATPSTKKIENYEGGNIPWITPKDLSNFSGRFISKGERSITDLGLNSCSAQMLPRHSVLFSSRAPIGYVAIAENDLCTNQGFKSVVPNDKTDFRFLYYLLKNNTEKIENMSGGTTFKEVSGSAMKNIEVCVPNSIDEQRKIGRLLGCLDDKIEQNARINKNLEQQAQALFKEYFLDNPNPAWKEGGLLDIADYLNGLAMQKFPAEDEESSLPILKIKELRQGYCDEESDLCSSNIKDCYIINDGDVIFSWSGTLLLDFWTGGKCGLNQHLFKVTSKKFDKWFYYSWTNHHLEKFIHIAADKATTMGHIKRDELEKAKVLIPDDKSYKKIGSALAPIYDAIIANRIENQTLAQLRDTLLPKLMSGELNCVEAAKFL